MNREFDREMDALLRRHTRAAARGRVLDDEGAARSPQSEHLDADELNAFAENALPAAARSLYVSHLADCADCRHAAAGLARTSNVSAESERGASAVNLKSSESAARGGWLAALFAPRVLRYAFPALALCLVGAIAFVALRSTSRQDAGQVAQHTEQPGAGESRTKITQGEPASQSSGIVAPSGATMNANASVGAGGAPPHETTQAAPVVQPPAGRDEAPDGAATTGPAPTSPEPTTADPPPPPPSADTQETVGVTVEAAPAPKPASKDKSEEMKAGEAAARARQSNSNYTFMEPNQSQVARGGQPRKVDIDQMPDGSRNTQRSETQQAGGRAANNTLPMLSRQPTESDRAASRRAPRAAAPRDRREGEEEAKEAETASVSGHRFRRQGGVWVDVRYSTSQKTTGVRRGSEGYRSLVADLPEIGRVAEQLRGEIIVVIKGRAYRIL